MRNRLSVATLKAELAVVQAGIDAAYWTYTRTKRGKPPVLVVPELYERRAKINAELKRRRHLGPGEERNNRGVYTCGVCRQIGHTRKVCPRSRQRRIVDGFSSANAAYRTNRDMRACDDCGAPSKRSRCRGCSERRKLWPSRQPGVTREYNLNRRPPGSKNRRRPRSHRRPP